MIWSFVKKMSTNICKDRLSGKVAVITASTEGIGFAIARRLAQEGAKVVISSRKQHNVDEAVRKLRSEDLKVIGTVCHVSNKDDRTKLYNEANSHFGGIDILVSNAAVNPGVGPVLECEESVWDKVFDINVKSAYLLAKEVLPHLRKRGGGNIVFISSIAGLQPLKLLGTYSVSKTALCGLTKAAAEDCAVDNIRVNCLAPGVIKTKFSDALTTNSSVRDSLLQSIPLNRFGHPDEMASIVSFLVSDDASYITGETIVASGGMASRL